MLVVEDLEVWLIVFDVIVPTMLELSTTVDDEQVPLTGPEFAQSQTALAALKTRGISVESQEEITQGVTSVVNRA